MPVIIFGAAYTALTPDRPPDRPRRRACQHPLRPAQLDLEMTGPARWLRVALVLLAAALAPAGLPLVSPPTSHAGGFRDTPELVYGHNGDLWLARADGTERRALTHHAASDLTATPLSWSPDGRWLAFVVNPRLWYPGDQRLQLMDVLTGTVRTVAPSTFMPQLAWSADSRRLIFQGVVDPTAPPGGPPLHAYDLALSRVSPIAVPDAGAANLSTCVTIPHVSPGAEWLAYLAPEGDLRFRHLPTGRERSLGAPPEPVGDLCRFVAWSPDARWFAWTRPRDDLRATVDPGSWAEPPRDVFALHIDAASVRDAVLLGVVSRGPKCCHWVPDLRPLVWSPDGRWLDTWFHMPELLARPDGASSGPTAAVPPAGGWPGLRDCAPADASCRARGLNSYHWSPDGAWVLYEATPAPSIQPREGVLRLVRLDSLGGPAPAVLDLAPTRGTSGFYATHLTSRFSPDSRYLAYLSPDGGLWTYDVRTAAHAHIDTFRVDELGIWSTVPVWRP